MIVNQVYCGDCLQLFKDVADETVDIVVTDPPYNIGVKYAEYRDNLPDDEYEKWCWDWLIQIKRVLKPNGTFWLVINPRWASELDIICRKTLGFTKRNDIIWSYGFGQNQKLKFSPCHARLLYYVKHPDSFVFNPDSIKVESVRQQMGDKRAKPGGKIPGDVWEFSRVCGTFNERVPGVPTQLPEKLIERILLSTSNENDLMLDCFAGSGTVLAVSQRLKRRFIGFELSQTYCDVINKRLGITSISEAA